MRYLAALLCLLAGPALAQTNCPAVSDGSRILPVTITGAPMPDGADAVVVQEETRREGDVVGLEAAVAAGANVRAVGPLVRK